MRRVFGEIAKYQTHTWYVLSPEYRSIYMYVYVCTDRWMDRLTDIVDGYVDRQMDRYTYYVVFFLVAW